MQPRNSSICSRPPSIRAPSSPRRCSQPRASIPPKYFYDALGSRLFEAICELPEYPLTRTERAIVDAHVHEIAARIGPGGVLIDLGAGNCEKAERLFGWLAPTQYVAIDIAADFLRDRLNVLAERNPQHSILGIAQDFTQTIELPEEVARGSRVLFYPGSSIGNFAPEAGVRVLAAHARSMRQRRSFAAGCRSGQGQSACSISPTTIRWV